ncbi:M23 family metallopeptidase [Dethiobacter alkaliphilus]|uniref:M23 family metallopeptidase n=1 Tax=Dethiobacter alkaliphilus TaxID=427926 RepID=UPI002226D668|nr:M23 family metallopeptidase [Dethiobacter alkaliphilus]MCW3489016.1 M23 family metallopeptidase [Dethiobacter alkaliphilus]
MKNRTFTIMIVSKGRNAPINFNISGKSVYLAMAATILILLAIGTTLHTNRRLGEVAAKMPLVTEENIQLQAELDEMEDKLVNLIGQMEELEELSEDVRGFVSEIMPSAASLEESSEPPAVADDAEKTLGYLKERIPVKSQEMELLLEDVATVREKLEVTPNIMPAQGRITSPFGWRSSPFTGRNTFHSGIDIGGGNFGKPVLAAAAGRVVRARYQGGYGNLVIIDHGTYSTHYAHLRSFEVQAGDRVEKGKIIGQVGNTGYSTGPHLHFEIHKNGSPIDPLKMIETEAPRL